MKSRYKSHSQSFHQFQILGPSHLKKVYDPNSDMNFGKKFEFYCKQMTVLISSSIGTSPLKREHLILTKFGSKRKSFFVQCNASLEKYVKKNKYCPGRLLFCQFEVHYLNFEVPLVSVTVNHKIQLVCISLEVYTNVSPTIIFCPF